MGSPYIGEIRMVGFQFAPAGWAFCNGQLMAISENDTLFTLIGTTYGGDGQNTFGLPNLQSRVPLHMGTSSEGITYVIGEQAGVESVTLTTGQLPTHSHPFLATLSPGTQTNPPGNTTGQPNQIQPYIDDNPSVAMASNAVLPVGGSQPHENMMPFLTINFIISLYGIYPPQS
jgi:microcystin-dependent protein